MRPSFIPGLALALPLLFSRPAAAATATTLAAFQITGASTFTISYGTDGNIALGNTAKDKVYIKLLTGTTATLMSDHTGTLGTTSGTTLTPTLPPLIVVPADTTNSSWVVDTLAGSANKFLADNTFLSFHLYVAKRTDDPTKGVGDGHFVLINQDGSVDSVDLTVDVAFQ